MTNPRNDNRLDSPGGLALALKAKAGDTMARDELMAANEGIVYAIAKELARSPKFDMDVDDLKQVGWLAFMEAIDTFDQTRGNLHIHVAVVIRQRVRHAIQDLGSEIRLPRHVHRGHIKLRKIDPEWREFTLDQISSCLCMSRKSASLIAAPVPRKTGIKLDHGKLEQATNHVDRVDLKHDIQVLIRRACLPAERLKTVNRLYGLGCEPQTVPEIAKQTGVTRSAVWTAFHKSLPALRRTAERIGLTNS